MSSHLSRSIVNLTSLSLLLLFAGCGKLPTEELKQAEAAIAEAEDSGAADYAAESLAVAQATLQDAQAKVNEKDYKAAQDMAIQAAQAAGLAREEALRAKTTAKEKSTELLDRLSQRLTEIKDKAGKLKGAKAKDMASVVADLDGKYNAAKSDFDAENYVASLKLSLIHI